MPPRQGEDELCREKCHSLWHKFQIGIFTVKRQHAFDVALGKAFFFGQFVMQITRQTEAGFDGLLNKSCCPMDRPAFWRSDAIRLSLRTKQGG